MAAGRCKQFQCFLRNFNFSNLRWKDEFSRSRLYSTYAPHFKDPVLDEEEIDRIVRESQKEELLAMKVKATLNSQTTSPRYHPDIDSFINYVMRKGEKEWARNVVEGAFTLIKHIQLRKYHAETDPEKQKSIVLNPREIFFTAVKNVTPLFSVEKIRKSGSWYKVPVGITEKSARVVAMKWIVEVAKDKEKRVPLENTLAQELLAAAHYEGRALAKKIELHKLCESNRSYLNYWWT